MRFTKFFALGMAALVSLPLVFSSANAQSSIEKAFVAKSRLASNVWTKHDASSTIEVDHSAWDAFLGKYLSTDGRGVNRLAYSRVSGADKAALKDYLAALQAVDVTTLNRNEQYAYWLNLYNASTVNVALKHYPIKSILDIKSNALDFKGPFNDKIAKVNGQSITLDTIESGIVRPIWNDPRLHYAFNCAAVTCPNLGKKAYRGKTINAQLNSAARSYINDPRGIRVENGKVKASKIFFWYEEDFGGSEAGILKHINKYAGPQLKTALKGKTDIAEYEYDWALNQR
ncbi:MAG: DUF547 domain-containing protein [Pseudomonadota bacterium]